MKLYIVRHGETEWNKKRLIQGQTDIPLNDNGVFVAKLTADAYKKEGLTFSTVYSSPLQRAYDTAVILSNDSLISQSQIIKDDRLKEFDFGELEGQSLAGTSPDKPDDSAMYTCFYRPEIYQPLHRGETYQQVVDRIADFIRREIMTKEWEPDENVLVVCHGGVIRALICALMDKPIKDFWDTSHKNLSTNIFIYNNDTKEFQAEAISKYYYDVDAYAIPFYK